MDLAWLHRLGRPGRVGRVSPAPATRPSAGLPGEAVERGESDESLERGDLILRAGERLSPAAIEAVLLDHDEVREAAVVGAPDPTWGHNVVAFVALRPGRSLDVTSLIERCRAELLEIQVPATIHLVDALPKMPSGPVDRGALRGHVAAAVQAAAVTSGAIGALVLA